MFRGFSGYIQADAKSVYDALFVPPSERPPPEDGTDPDLAERFEVGCWAHARRKFWEAAIAKVEVAREALFRIARFFERDAGWKGKPPATTRVCQAEGPAGQSSTTAGPSSTTTAASGPCVPSPSAGRTGSSSAATSMPTPRATSCRPSPLPAFTPSTPRSTSVRSCARSRTGPRAATSSSPRSIGPPLRYGVRASHTLLGEGLNRFRGPREPRLVAAGTERLELDGLSPFEGVAMD